jgi:hypothetical protein
MIGEAAALNAHRLSARHCTLRVSLLGRVHVRMLEQKRVWGQYDGQQGRQRGQVHSCRHELASPLRAASSIFSGVAGTLARELALNASLLGLADDLLRGFAQEDHDAQRHAGGKAQLPAGEVNCKRYRSHAFLTDS